MTRCQTARAACRLGDMRKSRRPRHAAPARHRARRAGRPLTIPRLIGRLAAVLGALAASGSAYAATGAGWLGGLDLALLIIGGVWLVKLVWRILGAVGRITRRVGAALRRRVTAALSREDDADHAAALARIDAVRARIAAPASADAELVDLDAL